MWDFSMVVSSKKVAIIAGYVHGGYLNKSALVTLSKTLPMYPVPHGPIYTQLGPIYTFKWSNIHSGCVNWTSFE